MAYLLLLTLYVVYLILVLFPSSFVRWHARMYARLYPRERDRELADRLYSFGKFKMSDYITIASEHPESFPYVIWFFRLLGLIPLIGTTIILICLAAGR